MKAMVLTGYNRPLEYQSVADPGAGDDDIVIRVRAAGMCSTDIKIVTGRLADFIILPHIPGHEIAGDIVEKGRNVKHLEIGQTGTVHPLISCGRCEYCLTGNENLCIETVRLGFEADGGFAEYVSLPARNFFPAVKEVPVEKLAVLADAAGTPYHALTRFSGQIVGGTVMVTGCGGLGLNAVQIARMMGASVIACDIRKDALDAAERAGADYCIDLAGNASPSEEITDLTGGRGVDLVIEGVGKQSTVNFGLSSLKKQGTLVVMGYNPELDITIPFIDLHNKELKLTGTKICTKQDLKEVLRLVERGLLDPEISRTIRLEELNEGLESVRTQSVIGRVCVRN